MLQADEIVKLAAIVLLFLAVLIGSWLSKKVLQEDSELSRKAVHLLMGIVCLSFPAFFDRYQPVLVLCLVCQALLCSLRLGLFGKLGQVLFSVKRHSLGELYFPLGVFLAFFLSHDQSPAYILSIVILTFSDSLSALIGIRYGRHKYVSHKTHKSLEGSLVFFLSSFLFAVIILCFYLGFSAHLVLMAMFLASTATIVEAVSFSGLDNLTVPLSVVLVYNFVSFIDPLSLLCANSCVAALLAVRIQEICFSVESAELADIV